MTEKKSNQGTYVVLHLNPMPEEIGVYDAGSAQDALREACGTDGLTGRFKVVPQRNWKTFEVIPTTSVKIEVVE